MDNPVSIIGILAVLGVAFWALTSDDSDGLNKLAMEVGVRMAEQGQPQPEVQTFETPDDYVAFHSDQWGTKSHVAVAAGPQNLWIGDVLEGYDAAARVTDVQIGEMIHPNTSCDVAGYDGTARLQPVYATQSFHDAALSRQPIRQLDLAVESLKESYERSGYRGINTGPGTRLEVVDVVVPAGEPVHLALMSSKAGLIWSFHIAPGAQISGVTLIGGNEGGVLNLPTGVPIEAVTSRVLDDCDLTVMVQDYYEVGPEGRMSAVVDDALDDAKDDALGTARPRDIPTTIPELEAAVAAAGPSTFRLWKTSFELWFSRQFGQNPRIGIAGYGDVQVVVAGAPPATPVTWTDPQGGQLRLINGPVYLMGTSRERSAAWDALVVQRLEQRIGAPMETLHPNNQPEG